MSTLWKLWMLLTFSCSKLWILSEFSRWKFWFCQHLYVVSCGCCSKLWICQKHMLKIVDFVSTFMLKVVILSTQMLKVVNVVNTFVEKIVGESATNWQAGTELHFYLHLSHFIGFWSSCPLYVQLYLRYFQFLSFPYSLHQSVTSKILKSRVLDSFPPYGPKQLYFTHKGSPFIKSAMSIWTLPKFHLTIPIFFSETLFFESEFCLGL